MTESADILIIGGGVMGASIAFNLAKQGAGRVVLVERQALGNGTTGRSGAIVRQHYSNDFTIRMARESLAVFQHFADLVGGDCGFVTTGMVVLADEAGKEALRVNVQLQQEQGVNVQLIDGKTVPEVASGYSNEDIAVACYERDAGVADPMATTYWPIRPAGEIYNAKPSTSQECEISTSALAFRQPRENSGDVVRKGRSCPFRFLVACKSR